MNTICRMNNDQLISDALSTWEDKAEPGPLRQQRTEDVGVSIESWWSQCGESCHPALELSQRAEVTM